MPFYKARHDRISVPYVAGASRVTMDSPSSETPRPASTVYRGRLVRRRSPSPLLLFALSLLGLAVAVVLYWMMWLGLF